MEGICGAPPNYYPLNGKRRNDKGSFFYPNHHFDAFKVIEACYIRLVCG